MPEPTLSLLVRLAVAFLIGSIPFAVIAMLGTGVDIRKYGSGNPGFNNVLRYSKPRSLVCLAGDAGKGVAAVLALRYPGEGIEVSWLVGLAVMLGHCYSPFLRFNGGKGIATSAGVMLVLHPLLAAVSVLVYVAGRMLGRRKGWIEEGARASLAASALFSVLLLATEGTQQFAYAVALLAIVTWRHKDNLQRIAAARA
ncbi:MAG: glycerol-3-phosphate acyltransferase [Bryobacteraceae bacterium]|nr:glycerol-3-phosphate acyltransferase [Bryobacteraceae bacterium]